MAGKVTTHHKVHTLTGYGLIIGLPFAVFSAVCAVSQIADKGRGGFVEWLSSPLGGLGFLAFFTAAIWYCKLEMDEVVMDYLGGSSRDSGLFANKLAAIIVWCLATYAIIKLAFLG